MLGFKIFFDRCANYIAKIIGHPLAFVVAFLIVLAWAMMGPLFHFSDTWQLVINTGTTIVTFLIVFLIQNTQYRDTKSMQVKLDELIRAIKTAQNDLLDIEELSDEEINKIKENYTALASKAREKNNKKNHNS